MQIEDGLFNITTTIIGQDGKVVQWVEDLPIYPAKGDLVKVFDRYYEVRHAIHNRNGAQLILNDGAKAVVEPAEFPFQGAVIQFLGTNGAKATIDMPSSIKFESIPATGDLVSINGECYEVIRREISEKGVVVILSDVPMNILKEPLEETAV